VAGPTVRRRQLGITLRQLRVEADLTREQVATFLDCSPTKVTNMESGVGPVKAPELEVMLNRYGAADQLAMLEDLRREASTRGWWSTARLPDALATYVGLEYAASTICCFALELIPGLLQTERYARVLHDVPPRRPPEERDRRVAVRMRRQERLAGDNPLQLFAVIAESALVWCAHEPTVAAGQFQRLIELVQRPNVEIRVLPFASGFHGGMQGNFNVLGFPGDVLSDVAWQEYATGGHLIDGEVDVAELSRLYAELRSQALGQDESVALIAKFGVNTH
jgi:hypothetical protein